MTSPDEVPGFLLKRRRQAAGIPETWAVSYGDLITQLLVFFVVLVSSSSLSNAKLQRVQDALSSKTTSSPAVERIAGELKTTLSRHGLSDFVQVAADADGITMVIKDNLLFGSGEATIPAASQEKLSPIFAAFEDLPSTYGFSIEGHTDDVPIHTAAFASNWHLSAARALAVLALFEQHRIARDRLSVRALGEQKPLAPNTDAAGQPMPEHRQMNRSVVIRVK